MNKTKLMGILNLTPDSFSGDGIRQEPQTRIEQLIQDGADIIDIGAESTRPGAILLSSEEEWVRLEPVIKHMKTYSGKAEFSVDTRHLETARKCLSYGAKWINDVSGGSPQMAALIKQYDATIICMHSLAIPADSNQTLLPEDDPIKTVMEWAEAKIASLEASGVSHSNIVIDPGIGFGKTKEQSVALIRNISAFKKLGVKILIGHSRKSFLTLFADKSAGLRDPETLVFSDFLISQNIDYLRVHDVAGHRTMLAIKDAL
jgi:dihydropteroate synthase